MATDGVEAFLRAEEQAVSLVRELAELKEETESYVSARKALDEVSEGLSRLTNGLTELAGQAGSVVETLRSIGTPELLRAQEELTSEVGALRERLDRAVTALATAESIVALQKIVEQRDQAYRQDMQAVKEELSARLAGATAAVRRGRNLALSTVGLLLVTLALVAWLTLLVARG